MKYAYTAIDRNGKERTSVLEADTADEVRDILRSDGLYATKIRETSSGKAGSVSKASEGSQPEFSRSVGGAQLKLMSLFARELALLVSSGTPMVDALQAVERQAADVRWRGVVADVRTKVEEGLSLSEALHTHPRSFDPIAQSLVAAGEAGGNLSEMLNRLSALSRQQIKIRSNIVGAMVYPCLLVGVCFCVLTAMIVVVLPRFAEMFSSLDAELPASTAVLMNLSELIRSYWWAILPTIAGVITAVVLWMRTTGGRWAVSSCLLKAPQIGSIVRSLATARIARLLGVLVESRVPMLEALQYARLATTDPHYARMLVSAEEAVLEGEAVSGAFDKEGLIPPAVVEAIRNGEKSGKLGLVLEGLADYLDEDNEVLIRSLSSIVEPVILIVMGVVVAVVALSMFLPLFDLTAAASGGAM